MTAMYWKPFLLKYIFVRIYKYEGRPINKLQNGIILLIFKI